LRACKDIALQGLFLTSQEFSVGQAEHEADEVEYNEMSDVFDEAIRRLSDETNHQNSQLYP
jgi:hypothetical protein